ncbi:MAG TPA: CHASE2 domain-containing protein [Candidatus Angelobacter sp.]|nr:CHASE2 domain-containing protein [Candidatus Angelobacter sp.]
MAFHEASNNSLIEECSGMDAPLRALSSSDYETMVRYSSFKEARNHKVVLVTLTNGVEPDEVLANICLQRRFAAKLIDRLNDLRAAVIAFDKQYSTGACDVRGEETVALAKAMKESRAFVTRGLPTAITPEKTLDGKKTCLKEPETLDLPIPPERSGLLRLDADTRRSPLSWPVLQQDGAHVKRIETLAWVTARTADPESLHTIRLQRAFGSGEQPYSTMADIPTFSAITLLCGKGSGKATDWRSCESIEKWDGINGAIVVVGDHNGDTDRHNTLRGSVYGVDLQANYVAALLDQRYYLPLLSVRQTELAIVIFFIALQVLFWKYHSSIRSLVYAFSFWGIIFVGSIVILAFTGYLVTIWVQGINLATILLSFFEHKAARME